MNFLSSSHALRHLRDSKFARVHSSSCPAAAKLSTIGFALCVPAVCKGDGVLCFFLFLCALAVCEEEGTCAFGAAHTRRCGRDGARPLVPLKALLFSSLSAVGGFLCVLARGVRIAKARCCSVDCW